MIRRVNQSSVTYHDPPQSSETNNCVEFIFCLFDSIHLHKNKKREIGPEEFDIVRNFFAFASASGINTKKLIRISFFSNYLRPPAVYVSLKYNFFQLKSKFLF